MNAYNPKITPWQINEQDFPYGGSSDERLMFLLGYAILAPSSHNTQPWKFTVGGNAVQIFVDSTRWLRVADADRRELYLSVGCALENLLIAAEHFGYAYRVDRFPQPGNEELAAQVKFEPRERTSPFKNGALFRAIPQRHTNHQVYKERPIRPADLQRLKACCAEDDIYIYFTSDVEVKRQIDTLIVRGDAIQFADPAFREELGYWIGQGVFGTSWLMSHLGQLAMSYINLGKPTAKKDSELLMSAPVLALISSAENSREAQVRCGQVFERIFLTAFSLGISVQPMSQIVEVPELKADLNKIIPLEGTFPQHPFRLGYAEPEQAQTPRRPLTEVLTS